MQECSTTTGVIVAVDFAPWGGDIERGCDSTLTTGYDALHAAGFTTAGDDHDGPAFICRIDDDPPPSQDPCIDTPSDECLLVVLARRRRPGHLEIQPAGGHELPTSSGKRGCLGVRRQQRRRDDRSAVVHAGSGPSHQHRSSRQHADHDRADRADDLGRLQRRRSLIARDLESFRSWLDRLGGPASSSQRRKSAGHLAERRPTTTTATIAPSPRARARARRQKPGAVSGASVDAHGGGRSSPKIVNASATVAKQPSRGFSAALRSRRGRRGCVAVEVRRRWHSADDGQSQAQGE